MSSRGRRCHVLPEKLNTHVLPTCKRSATTSMHLRSGRPQPSSPSYRLLCRRNILHPDITAYQLDLQPQCWARSANHSSYNYTIICHDTKSSSMWLIYKQTHTHKKKTHSKLMSIIYSKQQKADF